MTEATKLYLMKHGRFIFRGSVIRFMTEFDQTYHVDNIMYLVTHPGGNVVIDTGFNEDSIRNSGLYTVVDKTSELDAARGLKCYFDPDKGDILAQLADLGYTPGDVKYVVNSHLHDSTCGGNRYFPESTFLVQRQEMMEALCPLPPYAGWYCRENFDLPALHYKQIEGDYDVFGDGAVVILHTPGHTNGHQSVVVRLKQSGTVILTISTGYVKQSLEQGQLTGYFYNADDQYRSVTRLREIHQRENALVVADHDPDADELYKFVPDYYD